MTLSLEKVRYEREKTSTHLFEFSNPDVSIFIKFYTLDAYSDVIKVSLGVPGKRRCDFSAISINEVDYYTHRPDFPYIEHRLKRLVREVITDKLDDIGDYIPSESVNEFVEFLIDLICDTVRKEIPDLYLYVKSNA